tara:strand:+ start:187 stop:543 length:357 start_codon:yes stop_codon:yes gene_type:complete
MNKQFNNEAMITSMEWVKEAVETAMEDTFKPVYKISNEKQQVTDIAFMWQMSNTTIYEKAVLTQLICYSTPWTINDLVFSTGVSISSIKRAVKSLRRSGIIINHPKVDGVILNPITLF